MPRIVTTLILVAVLASAFAASAWATSAYINGSFTAGNWLTMIGLMMTFTGMIVAGVYWMSTQAGRSKTNTELLLRLESLLTNHLEKFDEHIQHDAARLEVFLIPLKRRVLSDHDTRDAVQQDRSTAHRAG